MTESEKITLLEMYPPYSKVLGPYLRPDGREHIVLNDGSKGKGEKGKTKSISYPKAIVEVRNGVRLKDNETVDHIDRNPLNNSSENLQVLSRSDHGKLDAKRRMPILKHCTWCDKEFEVTSSQLNPGRNGWFCSRSCSGSYGAAIQNGRCEVADEKEFEPLYYTNKE